MKKFIKYFFILLATLLLSNIIVAKSDKVSALFESTSVHEVANFNPIALQPLAKAKYKTYVTNLEGSGDRIEVSESETDVEDFQVTPQLVKNTNYFTSYLETNLFGQLDCFTRNGLAPSKHIFYLNSIESFNIIFCVFRI